jgi:TrkA domain protein
MNFRSVELPGVGTKYEIETESGDKIAVVFLTSGKIQLYVLEKDHLAVIKLTGFEARRLGGILSGAILEAEEEAVEVAFSALADIRLGIHTYRIDKRMAGKTIGELAIRKRTGVTIIAISRKGKNIVNPSPSVAFEEGDIIVAMGEHEQIKLFEKEFLGI